jgi:hypothetical protein
MVTPSRLRGRGAGAELVGVFGEGDVAEVVQRLDAAGLPPQEKISRRAQPTPISWS